MKRSLTLGLLLPDITNPFFATIARSVEGGAREKDYVTILCDSGGDPETEKRALNVFQDRRVDAVIACPAGDDPAPFENLMQAGVPLIFVDRTFPGLATPSVISADFEAAKQVAEILVNFGHSTIGCLQGDSRTSTSRERTRGFQAGAGDANIIPVGNHFSVSDGYQSTRELLHANPRPTAIFSYGNVNALGALQALGKAGLRIPEDISLVSFDDQPYASVLATPLSAVVQDTGKMATEALRIALQEISEPGKNHGVKIKTRTEFLDRGSIFKRTNKEKT